jgi:molybdopterin-guanine dinucleotide biosynthesis protein A
MIPKEELTTVILAGGKSERMGTDKAFLDLKGQAFIERILQVTKGLTKEVMVIANTSQYESLGVPVYPDLIEDCGPVGGIYTAMQQIKTPYLLVLSCDIPLLEIAVLEHLIAQSIPCDANILTTKERWQPLTAIYNSRTSPVFKKALDRNTLKLRSLLSSMDLHTIACPDALIPCLNNINTPDDLKNVRDEYKD